MFPTHQPISYRRTFNSESGFLMNECMKKKLSTQTSKEEGNRPVLSKPPRRTYNTFGAERYPAASETSVFGRRCSGTILCKSRRWRVRTPWSSRRHLWYALDWLTVARLWVAAAEDRQPFGGCGGGANRAGEGFLGSRTELKAYNAYAKVSTRGRVFLAKFWRVFSTITFTPYITSCLEGLWRRFLRISLVEKSLHSILDQK